MTPGTITAGRFATGGAENRTYHRDRRGRFSSGSGRMSPEEFDSAVARAGSGDAALRATKHAPPDEQSAQAIRTYTGTGYKTINSALREGGGEIPESASHFTRQDIAGMDRALAGSGSTRAIVVTRGVTDHQVMLAGREIRPGLTWVDHGFVSTSTTPPERLGEAFAVGANPMRMRVLVPKGTKAMSPGPSQRRDVLDPDEVLLDRGLTYRVVRDNGVDAAGIRQVDVEVVSQ